MIQGYLFLLSVGAVTASSFFNLPVKPGFCQNPPIQSGFNVEQFFQRKWYTWKNTGNFFLGTSGSCSATEANIQRNEIKLLHYQYEPLLKRYVSIQGQADKTFTTFKGLRFPVEYQLNGRFNISMPLAIVDTDYDNWAVIYFCKQFFLSKIEMTWISLRNKDVFPDSSQMSKIKTSVHNVGSEIKDFQLLDNSKCGDEEPHF